MTQQLEAPQIGRRITRRVLGIVALGLVPTLLWFLEVRVPAWASVAAFVAAGVVAGLVARHELSLFRCPRCGASIRDHVPTNDEPETPIRYLCTACDVMWDSGLRTPSGL